MKQSNKVYNVIDLFAGAGGLSNGFEQTGKFKVIGAVEINPEAIQTYIANHEDKENLIIRPSEDEISDISKINFKQYIKERNLIQDEVVIIGGPPCQGFSNANRQKNYLISGNNQLVKEYARAIDEVRPIAFLMENVKTMNSNTHKFFVTNGTDSNHIYSSEEHLNNILPIDEEPFWEDDRLTLIETENGDLENLINEIFIKDFKNPILKSQMHISRVRSIFRKLKSKSVINVTVKKERVELENVIEIIKQFEYPNLENIEKLKEILHDTLKGIQSILSGTVIDNQKILKQIKPFITINQLLRYLEELESEKILIVRQPRVKINTKGNLEAFVIVKSYNIVKYLQFFFGYLGYKIELGVVKSSDFFVPQKRERFMILGVQAKDARKDVQLPEAFKSDILPLTVRDAIEDLENIEPTKNVAENDQDYIPIVNTKMDLYYRLNMENVYLIHNHINTDSEELSVKRFQAIKDVGGKNFHSLSDELKDITYADSSRTQNTVYLRLNYDNPSPTVINVRKSMWQHPSRVRAVSIREAARLQSFKDDFIFKGTKDKQYQQIGNAVPPLMARAVAEKLLDILGEKPVKYLVEEFE